MERELYRSQKDALFAEAKKRSITSYRPLKALAVELGIVEDYQEPP